MDRHINSSGTGYTFTHFVEFQKDDTLFCAARERESNRIQLYLIVNHTGQVYSRSRNQWEALEEAEGEALRSQVAAIHAQGRVPYYTTNIHFSN